MGDTHPRFYEGLFLFDSNEAAKDWDALQKHVLDILAKYKAEVLRSDKWSERKLAYDVGDVRRGTYLLVYFKAPPGELAGVRRDCQLSEKIVRELILVDETIPARLEAERIAREQGLPLPGVTVSVGDEEYADVPELRSRDDGWRR